MTTRYYPSPLDHYIDQRLYNGPYQPYFTRVLGISDIGCPYRGTHICTRCRYSPPVLCEYKCEFAINSVDRRFCQHWVQCPCGQDQTEQLREWGLIE